MDASLPPVETPPLQGQRPQPLPLRTWLTEGLRAGFLRAPRVGPHVPTPVQVAALVVLMSLLE
ncbi:MAG TPA: hypothetical protein VLI46_16235, partial [Ramlibacter sp.]|nr:hypothetical protein [Ramlibacter sp.]